MLFQDFCAKNPGKFYLFNVKLGKTAKTTESIQLFFAPNSRMLSCEKGGGPENSPECFTTISADAPVSPGEGRKRRPLGAGKHAAELG